MFSTERTLQYFRSMRVGFTKRNRESTPHKKLAMAKRLRQPLTLVYTLGRQNPGGYTSNRQQIGNIRNHHSTCADRHLTTDLNKLTNTSTDTYPAQISNPDTTGQPSARTDMHTSPQNTVMINTTACIQDSAHANSSIGIDDNTSEDHRSGFKRGMATDGRGRMHQSA